MTALASLSSFCKLMSPGATKPAATPTRRTACRENSILFDILNNIYHLMKQCRLLSLYNLDRLNAVA
jgi:hypothetical protein